VLNHVNVDEITSIAAANIGWDMLALMAKTPLTA
jgi:agmatinase